MITRLLVLLALLASLCTGYTASVTLAWDPSPDTNVAGYYLSWGTNSGNYTLTNVCPGAVTNNVVSNLTPYVVYFFAVAAYSEDSLMSDWSNEVTYTNNPPILPADLAPPPERMHAKKLNAKSVKVGTLGLKK